jgi:antitoxin VapB
MSLNIKNEEVHAAVRALALRLGVSQTSAVELAVRGKLAELEAAERREHRSRRLREAVDAAQEAYRGVDLNGIGGDLYDPVTGLPR